MKNHDPMTNKTKGPIPLPAGEVPTGTRCVSLCIPDDNEYYRMLVGAIYELTHWNNYERDDSHKGTLVAQAWRRALMQGLLQCNQFRNNGGRLEFSSDGGATWTPVSTVPPGEGTYSPKDTGTIQPARTGSNKACLAARNAAECIKQLHEYMSNWYATYGTALTVALFIQAILVVFMPLDWPIALAIISFDYLAQSMLTLADALYAGAWDSTVTDTLTCILYCNADGNGQWNAAEFAQIRSELQTHTEHIYALIDLWLDQVIGIVGLNNAGTTNSIADYDCIPCGCGWCFEWDFTQDPGAFYVGVCGQYALGSGFEATAFGTGVGLEIKADLPEITDGGYYQVEAYVTSNTTNGNFFAFMGATRLWADVNPVTQKYDSGIKPVSGPALLVLNPSGIPAGRTIIISKVRIRGTGTNPYGPDNCTE